jgi:hypothetical protein
MTGVLVQREGKRVRARRVTIPLLLAMILSLWPTTTFAIRLDTEACRRSFEAVARGDVESAIRALEPKESERRHARSAMEQMRDTLKRAIDNLEPQLERVLPDAVIETGLVGLQIWSFGDQAVLIFGCHVRQRPSGHVDFFFEGQPSVDLVLKNIREKMPK